MDRKSWIVVILCVAGLGLWQWANVKYYTPTPEQREAARRAAERGGGKCPGARDAPTDTDSRDARSRTA